MPLFYRFIPLIFQKYKKKPPFLQSVLTFLAAQNLPTWLKCTIWNRGVLCACAYTWAHKKYLQYILYFQDKIFWKNLFYNQIYWAQNDPFWESKIILYLKQSYLFLKMWPNTSYQPVLTWFLGPAVNQSQTWKSCNDVWTCGICRSHYFVITHVGKLLYSSYFCFIWFGKQFPTVCNVFCVNLHHTCIYRVVNLWQW